MSVFVVLAFLALAAVDLPSLWRQKGRAGELLVVIVLLAAGLVLSLSAVGPRRVISLWPVIEAVFKPLGSAFRWE